MMRGLQMLAKDQNLTIVGIMPASNNYCGRERIDGDGLLPRLASTVVILDPGSTSDKLKATIMPLNRKQETFELSIS